MSAYLHVLPKNYGNEAQSSCLMNVILYVFKKTTLTSEMEFASKAFAQFYLLHATD